MDKSQRISWLGHLERMEEDRMPKKIFTQKLEGTRRRGRPRKIWKEIFKCWERDVGESWWRIEKNGRTLFDRPKPTVGCSANGRRRRWRRRRRKRCITGCASYMSLIVTVSTLAECLRTDCNILGGKIKKKRDLFESRWGFCAVLIEVLGCCVLLYIHNIRRLYIIHRMLYFYSFCITVELH